MTFLQDASIVLTLLLLEAVLSFDNAAILAAIVRRLPKKDRRKALLYGLGGAYVLRIAAILVATWLIENPFLKVAGGGYLLILAIRHFVKLALHDEEKAKVPKPPRKWMRLGMPALVATIIQIELIDLAFAIDQVVVAVAFTDEITLIIIASMLGILFLRLAAAIIARVMDWLPTLEHMAYVAVGYVGFKLMLLHPFFVRNAVAGALSEDGRTQAFTGDCYVPFLGIEHQVPVGASPGCEIPTMVSVGLTLALFAIPILVKLLFGIPKSVHVHAEVAEGEGGEEGGNGKGGGDGGNGLGSKGNGGGGVGHGNGGNGGNGNGNDGNDASGDSGRAENLGKPRSAAEKRGRPHDAGARGRT